MRIDNVLIGQRIIIRNYEKSDRDFLTGMWFDEENGKYMSDPTAEYVDEVFQKALDTLGESQFGYYLVITLADTMESIGSFCIFPDEDKKVYDIGYCIHKKYWKNGYGSEAVSLVLDWLKEQGADKVTAEVAVDNIASNALLQKFGFEVEKKTEFKKYNMDVRFDSYIYAKALLRTISIIPMVTDEDMDGKGYVHWKSWHETYTGLIDPAYMERITLEKCVDMAHRWPQNMMVAKDGDKVIGFVGYGEHLDDTLTDCGEVFAIYVLAEYYGQKIGYALMNAAFEKLAAYKKIAVWVLKGNDRAIRFYERYGFRFDGTEKEVKLGTPNTELRMVYEKPNAQALYELAMKHIYGDGVSEDNELAVTLLTQAHDMGHVEATYNLGICYHYGYGTAVDLAKAYDLYLESANGGYGKGMELVGRFYNRGIYVAQDRKQAEYWLQKATESTDPDAVEEAQKELEQNG